MERNRWKLIAGGAALLGVTAGAITAAADDGGFGLNDRRAAIDLAADDSGNALAAQTDDGSPESADSPNESVEESTDSPFDSPGDPGWVDPSPESADSPNESPTESADSPNDSPGDPGWVDPSPESADSPNESPTESRRTRARTTAPPPHPLLHRRGTTPRAARRRPTRLTAPAATTDQSRHVQAHAHGGGGPTGRRLCASPARHRTRRTRPNLKEVSSPRHLGLTRRSYRRLHVPHGSAIAAVLPRRVRPRAPAPAPHHRRIARGAFTGVGGPPGHRRR